MILANLWYILIFLACLVVAIIFYTYWERRFLGFAQGRLGPNRLGYQGILQPIADTLKLLLKKIIIPKAANKFLFLAAPMIATICALSAWAVIPFSSNLVLANLNLGLIYLLAVTSLGVYGIIIGGWAANSKYAMLSAMRASAQMISYEIPLSLCIIGVILKTNTMNLREIVMAQQGGISSWLFLPLLPLMIIFWISAMAESNRAPFDVAEGESELVAGFHVEYSATLFALFFLAEYANMILHSAVVVLLFFGGWLSPLPGYFTWVPEIAWLLFKMFVFMTLFLLVRATLPRYRYDQIMQLCWKALIPISLIWLVIEAIWLV